MKIPYFAGCLVAALAFSNGALAQVVVYSNLAPDQWTKEYPSGGNLPQSGSTSDEIGDEINLADSTPRTVSGVQVQYKAQNLSGDEVATIRLYLNDGDLTLDGFKTPSTVLYESSPLPVSQLNGYGVLTLNNVQVSVPDSFTWSVQFSGLSANESLGLAVTGDTTAGSSFDDFWQKASGNWNLYHFENPPDPGSFGAEITAVPEPAATGAVVLGAAFLITLVLRLAGQSARHDRSSSNSHSPEAS